MWFFWGAGGRGIWGFVRDGGNVHIVGVGSLLGVGDVKFPLCWGYFRVPFCPFPSRGPPFDIAHQVERRRPSKVKATGWALSNDGQFGNFLDWAPPYPQPLVMFYEKSLYWISDVSSYFTLLYLGDTLRGHWGTSRLPVTFTPVYSTPVPTELWP